MMNNDDEREKLASMMNQEQTYIQCIVQTGYTQSMPDEFMSIVRDGKTTITNNNNHTFRCASTIMLQRIKQLSNQCIRISMQTVHVRYIQ